MILRNQILFNLKDPGTSWDLTGFLAVFPLRFLRALADRRNGQTLAVCSKVSPVCLAPWHGAFAVVHGTWFRTTR